MNAPLTWSDIASAGAFTTDQVSKLTGASVPEVGSWLRGKTPLICTDYEPMSGRIMLSFEGLLEARVISYLLDGGMKRSKVRELVKTLRVRLGDRHPLAREQRVVTDGARAFDATDDRLVNLLNDCYASPELMKPALHGRVVYEQGRALHLIPMPLEFPQVQIDPRRAFGRPVLVEGKKAVPTETLARSAKEEGQAETGDWYGLSPEGVRQAVGFEERLAA